MLRPEPDVFVFDPLCYPHLTYLSTLTLRVHSFENGFGRKDSGPFTRRLLTQLVLGNPNFRAVLAVLDKRIVAHCVAEITLVDDLQVLYLLQLQVDPGFSHVVDKILAEGDNWGKSMNVKVMRLEVTCNKSEQVWKKLYGKLGFEFVSRVMERPI